MFNNGYSVNVNSLQGNAVDSAEYKSSHYIILINAIN
jgi:hypothetical protein